jgi:hypothetical protein
MATAAPFNYRYPLTKLTTSDDYLRITFLEYVAPGLGYSPGTLLPKIF